MKSVCNRWSVVSGLCAVVFFIPFSLHADSLKLARELSREGDHYGAAIEFRRAAMEPGAVPDLWWGAAWETWQDGRPVVAEGLIDEAEDGGFDPVRASLLRAETARSQRRWVEAGFHYSSVVSEPDGEPRTSVYSKRRLAALRVRQGDYTSALNLLREEADTEAAIRSIESYVDGRDKSPVAGAVLGLVPGMGYLYAGEPANALRSLILNGLFIFGMVETADDEDWGAFAVITFFEFTWYSGSIYGGIDASQRFNRDRLEAALEPIDGGLRLEPDYRHLPEVGLRLHF